MKEERRMILSLVATGHLSAAEAERLIAAWAVEREGVWVTAACATVIGIQVILHGLGPALAGLAPAWSVALQHAAEIVKGVGGLL